MVVFTILSFGVIVPSRDFPHCRDRLLEGEVAGQFLAAVLSQAQVKALLSSDHFSIDGALLEAWASPNSFPQSLARAIRPVRDAIASGTFTASSKPTTRTPRSPTPMPVSTARARVGKPGSVSSAMR
jgi:hypothetical protein